MYKLKHICMNICVMLKKNSYRKTSRNSLVFVPLNGVLIKKIRKTEQDQSHTSLQVNILTFIYILRGKKYRTYLIWYRLIS